MPIPGLEAMSMEDNLSGVGEGVTLFSFEVKPFKIPESHMHGKCRHISEFSKICRLGEGAFGTVYKVIDTKNGETYALKKLKIETRELSLMPLNFLREIHILKLLNNVNVIHFNGIAVGKNFASTYLIMEYCPYNLSKVIDDKEAILEYAQIKCIMAQLFGGLAYIHDRSVLHRDLSVTNILFTATGILKISDFGFSRLFSTSDMTPNVVSRWYIFKYRAPELLFGSKIYTTAVDMWAAGCIFTELLQRKPLFPADTDNDMIKQIIDILGTPNESVWPGLEQLPIMQSYNLRIQPYNRLRQIFHKQSGTCISLLHKLFLYNPANRFTAKSSLEHTFFLEKPHACSTTFLLTSLQASETI